MSGTEETRLDPAVFDAVAPRVGRQIGDGVLDDAEGRGLRIGLACALFNGGITERLLDGALEGLSAASVDRADTTVAWVPGAFELPLAAQRFATEGGVDAVACLGAVIRGDTAHFDFVAGQCAAGLARVALDTGIPVVFGVLTTDTVDQALERARPDETNKGREAVLSAVQMAAMLRRLGTASPRARPGRSGPEVLRLVLPKGSLEEATLRLFADADLPVKRSSEVDYRARINDDRIAEVRILRPQEIPLYVAQGLFDLGITGRDWIEERSADVVSLGQLPYSKASGDPVRIVLAVPEASPAKSLEDLTAGDRPLRVSTEYPEITRRALEAVGVDAEISLSYGATEAKVPDIADCVVELTETGRALRAAGLRSIHTLLESSTELIANPATAADPEKRRAMDQIYTLLMGTLEAREKVLVKLNVSAERREAVLERLPSLRSPTVSELAGDGGFAIETVVMKNEINTLIPELKELGASDILELALAKIVH